MKMNIEKKKLMKILLVASFVIAGIGFVVYCYNNPSVAEDLSWMIRKFRWQIGL